MNRELKFRAWDGEQMIYDDNNHRGRSLGYVLSKWESNIMQFIGLQDKNGINIYEGDIVKFDDNLPILIEWNNKFASFCLYRQSWVFPHFFGEAGNSDECEIIGNIHENLNLIKPQIV